MNLSTRGLGLKFPSDDPRLPYHPAGPYQPAEPATPEHLLKCIDGAGVDYAVVAHPEPYQDDHRLKIVEFGEGEPLCQDE